jgi:hypothetical protein
MIYTLKENIVINLMQRLVDTVLQDVYRKVYSYIEDGCQSEKKFEKYYTFVVLSPKTSFANILRGGEGGVDPRVEVRVRGALFPERGSINTDREEIEREREPSGRKENVGLVKHTTNLLI